MVLCVQNESIFTSLIQITSVYGIAIIHSLRLKEACPKYETIFLLKHFKQVHQKIAESSFIGNPPY